MARRGFVLLAAAISAAAQSYVPAEVTRPDSATIAYYVRHNGPARPTTPPLILMPGSWGDYRVFDRFVAALPPAIPVVVVELRGHGRSRPAAADPSMEGLARDVLAVVDHLRLRRFYVGGHSIGGMLAIEMAGQRPEAVAGVIAMEGWTHHLVQREAFGTEPASLMTPEEEKQNNANRERVRRTLTAGEIAAFASVWRRWDGWPILEAATVPVLEVWGDRGRPRPTRAQLRVPEKPGIELAWMAGSGHSLLVQRPEEVARETLGFIARTQAARMFTAAPRMPKLASETATIYRGEEGTAGFNMHPYIAHHGGRFWAMWSSNRVRDLQAGQHVRFATSLDGVRWTAPRAIMPPEAKENSRYFARGFWVRGSALWAMAARDTAVRPLFAPDLELRGYPWSEVRGGWDDPVVVARDAINNFPPELLPGGDAWMMSRRDHRMRAGMLVGGRNSVTEWSAVPMPAPGDGAALDEPTWWAMPDGVLAAVMRDGSRSRRLYRSLSYDNGRSWSVPVRTDFPDATAKFNTLRLNSGVYVMASNPNQSGKRIPLCLSASRDGLVFDRMAVLCDTGTVYRYAGKDPGYAGYHYPQLLEHGDSIYVVYSENMEDIRMLRLRRAEVERWARE